VELTALPLTPWLHLRDPTFKGKGGEEEGREKRRVEKREFAPPQSSPQIDAPVRNTKVGLAQLQTEFVLVRPVTKHEVAANFHTKLIFCASLSHDEHATAVAGAAID